MVYSRIASETFCGVVPGSCGEMGTEAAGKQSGEGSKTRLCSGSAAAFGRSPKMDIF